MSARIDNLAPIGTLFKKPRPRAHKSDMGRDARERDPAHLAAVRKLPCLACGAEPCDAAHVRRASAPHGKRATGKGEKPDDKWTLPLCRPCHDRQHKEGEFSFWWNEDLSPFKICIDLYKASLDLEAMRAIIGQAREQK